MKCGKSTELKRRYNNYKIAKKKVFAIRPETDTIDKTHSNEDKICDKKIGENDLMKYFDKCKEYDCIFIDEGQFFSNLITFCEKLADCGKIVNVAALDGYHDKTPFGQICELIPRTEDVKKFNSVCVDCGSIHGAFSFKIDQNDKQMKNVKAEYKPLCRKCYNLFKKNKI